MKNIKVEKAIMKMDRDIEALSIAGRYLSNAEEINAVKEDLNKKRQMLVNELYSEDGIAYGECCRAMEEMLDRELAEEEQVALLGAIREAYGRQTPMIGKKSNGLNAWLKHLNIEYNWVDSEEIDWSPLVITGLGMHE